MKRFLFSVLALTSFAYHTDACIVAKDTYTLSNIGIYSLNGNIMHYYSKYIEYNGPEFDYRSAAKMTVVYHNRMSCDLPITVQYMPLIVPAEGFSHTEQTPDQIAYTLTNYTVPVTQITLMYRVFDSNEKPKGPIKRLASYPVQNQFLSRRYLNWAPVEPPVNTWNMWIENLFGNFGVIDIPDSEISQGDYIVIGIGISGGPGVLGPIAFAPYMDEVDASRVSTGTWFEGSTGSMTCSVIYSGRRRPMVR